MRSAELQVFLNRLQAAFGGAEVSAEGRLALDKVFARLAVVPGDGMARPADEGLAVTGLLAGALATAKAGQDALADLARAVEGLAPALGWTRRKVVGPTASPGFADAHANAAVIGANGLEPREDVWLGISLMAPGTRYPDHTHPPEEVYISLTPGAFLQGESEDWIERQPGETIYNTPGIRHAMKAGDTPFLAIWCLPV